MTITLFRSHKAFREKEDSFEKTRANMYSNFEEYLAKQINKQTFTFKDIDFCNTKGFLTNQNTFELNCIILPNTFLV